MDNLVGDVQAGDGVYHDEGGDEYEAANQHNEEEEEEEAAAANEYDETTDGYDAFDN